MLSGTILDGEAVSSAAPSATSTVTADRLSVTNSATPPPTKCPASWTCADIGAPIPSGSNYLVNGEWSLLGGGKDIWGPKDEFHYTAETMPGDGTISAKITSQQNTDPWAKAGLMFRAGTDQAAPYYAIFATPGNGTVVQYRTTQGPAPLIMVGGDSSRPACVLAGDLSG